MRRDVERVLRAELEPAFNDPLFIAVAGEFGEWPARMSPQSLHGRVEREQVTPHDRGIDLSRGHRPNCPVAIRARCAASILTSCGT